MKREIQDSVLTHSLAQEAFWLLLTVEIEKGLNKYLNGDHLQLDDSYLVYVELKSQPSPNGIPGWGLLLILLACHVFDIAWIHGLYKLTRGPVHEFHRIRYNPFSPIGLHIKANPPETYKCVELLSQCLRLGVYVSMRFADHDSGIKGNLEKCKSVQKKYIVSHVKWIHHFNENLGFFTLVTHCLFHDRTLWEDKQWLSSVPLTTKKWGVLYFRCCFPDNILPLIFYHSVLCQICMSLISDIRASTMTLLILTNSLDSPSCIIVLYKLG